MPKSRLTNESIVVTSAIIEGVTVAVVGRFNPSIFSPSWLRLHKLIGAREAEEANVTVIVPPAAVFSTDWLVVNVTEESLVLSTAMPQEYERLRDVALGILTVLDQTPIGAVGINRDVHWAPPGFSAYHAFGDALVPKEFWNKELRLPGTQDVTVQGVRPDLWDGYIRVTIQPSVRVEHGVYARVNDHFILRKVDAQPRTRDDFLREEFRQPPLEPAAERIPLALEILRDEWAQRTAAADRIIELLISLADNADKQMEQRP
jgi:hypothetical protein